MKVLIADDHPMVRDALARTLHSIDPTLQVIEADHYDAVVSGIEQGQPDLALLDLKMPGMDAVSGLKRLRERFPALKIVVASAEDDPAVIRSVFGLGVAGFLPKSEAPEVLRRALELVLSGGTYLPTHVLTDYIEAPPAARRPDASGLTPRQLDVLRLLMLGQPNKLIARELVLTEGTVKIHIAAILRALQARNRTEAALMARSMGLEG